MLTLRYQTIECTETLVLSALDRYLTPRGGVDYKSTRAQLSVSLFRPGELLATSLH